MIDWIDFEVWHQNFNLVDPSVSGEVRVRAAVVRGHFGGKDGDPAAGRRTGHAPGRVVPEGDVRRGAALREDALPAAGREDPQAPAPGRRQDRQGRQGTDGRTTHSTFRLDFKALPSFRSRDTVSRKKGG